MLGGGAVLAWAATRSAISLPLVGSVAPWQLTFLAMGLPGLLVALLLAVAHEPEREPSGSDETTIRATLLWLRSRWRPFASLMALVCVMTIVAYSQNWYAALFQRQWGWDITRYATWSGLALVIIGPLVVNSTGWWCDRLQGRGLSDGALTVAVAGTLLLLPPGIVAPLMPTGELAFAVWLLNLCGLSMVSAAAPVALLAITPGSRRADVRAAGGHGRALDDGRGVARDGVDEHAGRRKARIGADGAHRAIPGRHSQSDRG
jgi:hypothetical protein